MLASERQKIILEELKKNNTVKASNLVNKFGITIETARHDLTVLQNQGYARRVYGGAVLVDSVNREPLYLVREEAHANEKKSIGKAAAALISSGDSIILDSGTTALQIARHIKTIPNLTVFTTSVPIINELANSDATVIVAGGILKKDELSTFGPLVNEALKNIFVNKAFLSATGVTTAFGVSYFHFENTLFCQLALNQAEKAILVADSSKFGGNALSIGAPLSSFHTIITDSGLSKEYADEIEKAEIELITTQP